MKHPIIVFGDDWGRHVSTMQHLFRPLVEHLDVIWINGIGHRVPTLTVRDLRRAVDKAGKIFLRRHDAREAAAVETYRGPGPADILNPSVLPWHHIGPVYARNLRVIEQSIRAALATRRGERPFIVTGTPPSAGILGRLGEVGSLYICMDDYLHLEGVTSWMLGPLEQELLRRVDCVVATAESLTRSKVPASGEIHYLPQGVNYEHFANPRPVPPELADLPRPIVGFAGGVSGCCDLSMFTRLAERLPSASIVLVGPQTVDVSSLAGVPNIHLLGRRPYDDLPAYVQAFDVGIIPYVLNEWTLAVDPLKLLEYLAAGIPVVTSDIPEVRKYSHRVAMRPLDDSFIEAVVQAVASGRQGAEAGRELARANTWAARAKQLLGIMEGVASRAGAAA